MRPPRILISILGSISIFFGNGKIRSCLIKKIGVERRLWSYSVSLNKPIDKLFGE